MTALEQLTADLQSTLPESVEWWINYWAEEIVVLTQESRDPSRRNNGGEYDYYRAYAPSIEGVTAYDECSADFDAIDRNPVSYPVSMSFDDLIALCEQIAPERHTVDLKKQSA